MTEKMKFETKDLIQENIAKIGQLFPEVLTEAKDDNGILKKAIDFDKLRQILSDKVIDNRETYDFTWVGKKQAILEAATPIRKTLRPCKEESVNWDTTQNLYIEGDNLDVLKLLQDCYPNQVKMIYIDPPYNTGNDFIYKDDFAVSQKEYNESDGRVDECGNRLVKNTDSNGRLHSDWCSMMYPRLKLARNLLTDDGVIFISIDDREVDNLRKICDEIFGERNFESIIKWRRRSNQPNDTTKMLATVSEYAVVYAKNSDVLKKYKTFGTVALSEERLANYSNPDNDPKGDWSTTPWCASKGQGGSRYTITTPTGRVYDEIWLGTKETFEKHLQEGRIVFTSNGDGKPRKKVYKSEALKKGQAAIDFWVGDKFGDNLVANSELKQIFELDRVFDYSKPVKYLWTMTRIGAPTSDAIILDFFSGSATTAHAVMKLNAEDGGNRKFIMVQLPEPCDEKSEAYKAGYKNICEIGKERIRRAAKQIKGEHPEANFDGGFRVFKLAESNMKEVYFSPSEYKQDLLSQMTSNIKEDRTDMDLLYGCMLEWKLPLSFPHTSEKVGSYTIHNVNNGALMACFDENIPEDIIRHMAAKKPRGVVFRDAGFADSPAKINVWELFKLLSPDTKVKVM